VKKADWTKFLRFWFPLVLYSGIIFYASSMSDVKTPLQKISFDKLLHVFIYLPFGFLLARSVYQTGLLVSRNGLLGFVLLGALLYGASDEIHQAFVPGRSMEFLDVMADMMGGLLGGCLYLYLLRIREKRIQE
jgi:VanZ family protein